MKYNNLKAIVLLFSIVLLSTSCSSWIDEDLNISPNSPTDVSMKLLLPSVQQNMGYNLLGNNSVRTTNIWMQQFDGTDRQSFTEARYQLTPADVNNFWNSIYAGMLINNSLIIKKADETGSPNFAGVAHVLNATTLEIATNLFGDMPFSEALDGSNEVYKPAFDSQETLFETIASEIDKAVVALDNSENAFAISGDVIYNGDVSNWKKAAYSIKARAALQLSNKNGNAAYTDALAALTNGFQSNADDFEVKWETANQNPIFQFMEQRGDIRMGATLVNMLLDNSDPRLPFYANKDSEDAYSGSEAGTENTDASPPGVYVASEDASTRFMTYSELKFIEAEAHFMLGHTAQAQTAFETAVAASVLRVTGDENTAWLDANINGVAVTHELIMTQKYIDGFGTNQPYADYRRTGFPALSIATGAVLSNIPVRFPYGQDEINYNTDNVPSVTISDKLWWDQ